MSLTEKEIKKIAKLSRIKLTEDEVAHFGAEISGILHWVEMLQEIDTRNIKPMASVCDMHLPLRADEINDGDIREQVLANAPNSQYGYFVVPKVVE